MVTSRENEEFLKKVLEKGIKPVSVPRDWHINEKGEKEYHKSLGDPMLITDVMKILYEMPHIDFFIIISSDKDIIPLLHILAYKGKKCIVGGFENASDFLKSECTRLGFKFVTDIVEPRIQNKINHNLL